MSEVVAAGGNEPLLIGRYALFDAIAAGGMATVHLGRLLGPAGFGRTVAVKRLHSQFASDHDFVTMFMDEARIVARILHPNVVPMIDVLESGEGLFLVMEYIHGESYSKLLRAARARREHVPLRIVSSIMQGLLHGLHAAHETRGQNGELLAVVHRDVSPQNVIIGADGVARVLDFGVAKAAGRAQVTREGQIKGKLAYMAPEQISGVADRRADVFAASVVLWESLAGRRLHEGAKDVEIVARVVEGGFPPPSQFREDISPELDAVVMKGLEVSLDARYQTAREMAIELERTLGNATASEIADWVAELAAEGLAVRAAAVVAMEEAAAALVPQDPRASRPNADLEARAGGFGVGEIRPRAASRPALDDPSSGHHRPQESSRSGRHAPFDGSDPALHRPSVEVPSVTTHSAATPMGTEMPLRGFPPPPQQAKDLAPVIAMLSFCGMLGVVGIVLMVLSLQARRPKPVQVTQPPATATTVAAPPSAAPLPSVATPVPSVTVSALPAETATAAPSATAPTSTIAPPATTPPVATTAKPVPITPPVVTPKPTARPQPTPAPAAKGPCDPPYITDAAGHRKYKVECMTRD